LHERWAGVGLAGVGIYCADNSCYTREGGRGDPVRYERGAAAAAEAGEEEEKKKRRRQGRGVGGHKPSVRAQSRGSTTEEEEENAR
jgi:hypothetical protein